MGCTTQKPQIQTVAWVPQIRLQVRKYGQWRGKIRGETSNVASAATHAGGWQLRERRPAPALSAAEAARCSHPQNPTRRHGTRAVGSKILPKPTARSWQGRQIDPPPHRQRPSRVLAQLTDSLLTGHPPRRASRETLAAHAPNRKRDRQKQSPLSHFPTTLSACLDGESGDEGHDLRGKCRRGIGVLPEHLLEGYPKVLGPVPADCLKVGFCVGSRWRWARCTHRHSCEAISSQPPPWSNNLDAPHPASCNRWRG